MCGFAEGDPRKFPTPRLLDAVCRRGVLVATSVRYWRGCKRLNPEGLNRLRENAVQLARSDAREVISRFGQMAGRMLAAVG